MKRQPAWMKALLAVFLCLCASVQSALGQTAGRATVGGTYYQTDGTNTLVFRLLQTGSIISAYGAGTTIVPAQPDGLLGQLLGSYDPVAQQIRITVSYPLGGPSQLAIYGFGLGTYNPATDTFSITFTDNQDKQTQTYNNVALDTGAIPYMVGIWFWNAAADPGRLFSNPPYSGEFHIISQDPDGRIRGTFGKTNPGDVGAIEGRISGEQVDFTRSGTDANGVAFSQVWSGTRTEDKVGILGGIEQSVPYPWTGDFEARFTYYRN